MTHQGGDKDMAYGKKLDEQEKEILMLPQKFTVYNTIKEDHFMLNLESINNKLRFSARDQEHDKDDPELTEQEEATIKIMSTITRMIYNLEEGTVSGARRKATDMPQNARITLPKAIEKSEEAEMLVRSERYLNICKNYINKKQKIWRSYKEHNYIK